MHWITALSLGLALVAASGCFHAQVTTGASRSAKTVERPWAHAFAWGLVPPAPVPVARTCGERISKVETRHSAMNVLASLATLGIWSPMTITVTCARR